MPFTDKQNRYFHAAAARGEPGMHKLAKESEDLMREGHVKPPVHAQKMSDGGYACMHCGGEAGEDGYATHGFTTADDFDDSAEPYGESETPQMEAAGDLGLDHDEEDEDEAKYRPGAFADAVRKRAR